MNRVGMQNRYLFFMEIDEVDRAGLHAVYFYFGTDYNSIDFCPNHLNKRTSVCPPPLRGILGYMAGSPWTQSPLERKVMET